MHLVAWGHGSVIIHTVPSWHFISLMVILNYWIVNKLLIAKFLVKPILHQHYIEWRPSVFIIMLCKLLTL